MKEKRNLKNSLFKNDLFWRLTADYHGHNDVMLLYVCAGFGWGRVTFFTVDSITAICSTSPKHSPILATRKKINLSQTKSVQ